MQSPSATAIESEKKGMPRFALREPSIGSITIHIAPLPSLAARSISVVSSPPSPEPTTGSRSARAGSSARTPRTSSAAARQTTSQSVKRVEEQARSELRIEVRALLRHHLAAARDGPDVVDARRAEQERGLR